MKEFRLRRIFAADQRTVIVALDHAGFMGPLPGLDKPGKLLTMLSECGADAVLTTIGIARAFSKNFGRLGLILRVDGGSTVRSPRNGTIEQLFSVKDAVRLGADAVVCMGMIGFPEEPSSLKNLASLSAEAAEWNMPVMAEMLVKTEDQQPGVEDVHFAIRIGLELGADIIKTHYVGPIEKYQAALQECYRPIVVLGGLRGEEDELLVSVYEALQAGAAGVAIGRNIWQHPNPGSICRALAALVHGGANVAQAIKELET